MQNGKKKEARKTDKRREKKTKERWKERKIESIKKYPASFGAWTNVEFASYISISRRFVFIKNNW
jgi:hypothetical protein